MRWQRPLWVEPRGSIAGLRTAGIGAQQAFSRGGARVSNAPIAGRSQDYNRAAGIDPKRPFLTLRIMMI
jgi:hypothetical protein